MTDETIASYFSSILPDSGVDVYKQHEQSSKYSPFIKKRLYQAGENILVQDVSNPHIYILSSGTVEVLIDCVQISVECGRGLIFGEISSLLQISNSATVRALDTCLFYEIIDLDAFCEKNPTAMFYISRLLARRLLDLGQTFISIKNEFTQLSKQVENEQLVKKSTNYVKLKKLIGALEKQEYQRQLFDKI